MVVDAVLGQVKKLDGGMQCACSVVSKPHDQFRNESQPQTVCFCSEPAPLPVCSSLPLSPRLCRMFEDLIEAFCGLEPQVSPGGEGSQSGTLPEVEGAESSLSVGQFVLCHWSDGLYYLGKIQRVRFTCSQTIGCI